MSTPSCCGKKCYETKSSSSSKASDYMDKRQHQLKDAERTIANKDIIINMLQSQVKKMEENVRNNMKQTEDLRFKYCKAAEQVQRYERCPPIQSQASNCEEVQFLKREISKLRQQCQTLLENKSNASIGGEPDENYVCPQCSTEKFNKDHQDYHCFIRKIADKASKCQANCSVNKMKNEDSSGMLYAQESKLDNIEARIEQLANKENLTTEQLEKLKQELLKINYQAGDVQRLSDSVRTIQEAMSILNQQMQTVESTIKSQLQKPPIKDQSADLDDLKDKFKDIEVCSKNCSAALDKLNDVFHEEKEESMRTFEEHALTIDDLIHENSERRQEIDELKTRMDSLQEEVHKVQDVETEIKPKLSQSCLCYNKDITDQLAACVNVEIVEFTCSGPPEPKKAFSPCISEKSTRTVPRTASDDSKRKVSCFPGKSPATSPMSIPNEQKGKSPSLSGKSACSVPSSVHDDMKEKSLGTVHDVPPYQFENSKKKTSCCGLGVRNGAKKRSSSTMGEVPSCLCEDLQEKPSKTVKKAPSKSPDNSKGRLSPSRDYPKPSYIVQEIPLCLCKDSKLNQGSAGKVPRSSSPEAKSSGSAKRVTSSSLDDSKKRTSCCSGIGATSRDDFKGKPTGIPQRITSSSREDCKGKSACIAQRCSSSSREDFSKKSSSIVQVVSLSSSRDDSKKKMSNCGLGSSSHDSSKEKSAATVEDPGDFKQKSSSSGTIPKNSPDKKAPVKLLCSGAKTENTTNVRCSVKEKSPTFIKKAPSSLPDDSKKKTPFCGLGVSPSSRNDSKGKPPSTVQEAPSISCKSCNVQDMKSKSLSTMPAPSHDELHEKSSSCICELNQISDYSLKEKQLQWFNDLISYYNKVNHEILDMKIPQFNDKKCKSLSNISEEEAHNLQHCIDKVMNESDKLKKTISGVLSNIKEEISRLDVKDQACNCTSDVSDDDSNVNDVNIEDIYKAVMGCCKSKTKKNDSSVSKATEEQEMSTVICSCSSTSELSDNKRNKAGPSQKIAVQCFNEDQDGFENIKHECVCGHDHEMMFCHCESDGNDEERSLLSSMEEYMCYLQQQLDVISGIENQIEFLRSDLKPERTCQR